MAHRAATDPRPRHGDRRRRGRGHVGGELAAERRAAPARRPPAPRRRAARRGRGVRRRGRRLGADRPDRGRGRPRDLHRPADRDRDRARARPGAAACRSPPVGSLAALARGIGEQAPGRPRLAADRRPARRGLRGALRRRRASCSGSPFVARPRSSPSGSRELARPPVAAGDGSLRFREQLESAGVEVLPAADPAHRMAARHVCALAAEVEPGPPERRQARSI